MDNQFHVPYTRFFRYICLGLEKMDTFGSADPYLELYRMHGSGASASWILVHTTEIIRNTLSPVWKV